MVRMAGRLSQSGVVLTTGNLRPRGLSAFCCRVFDVLEAHVVSPWHLLSSICAWQNMDPLALTAEDVLVLAPILGSQVARVTDVDHGLHLTQALQSLAQSASSATTT
jgi:hypothetical protein